MCFACTWCYGQSDANGTSWPRSFTEPARKPAHACLYRCGRALPCLLINFISAIVLLNVFLKSSYVAEIPALHFLRKNILYHLAYYYKEQSSISLYLWLSLSSQLWSLYLFFSSHALAWFVRPFPAFKILLCKSLHLLF